MITPLDMDTATHCTRCKAPLNDYRVGIGPSETGWREVICPTCDRNERILAYQQTGEMSSRLVTEAVMAEYHLGQDASYLSRLRRDVLAYYESHRDTLLEIAAKNHRIAERAREWEEKHWLGKLQRYYQDSPVRGHGCATDAFKAMLWGSAGRVLLTIQDRHPKGHPQSRFDGAWITLIFDEDSPVARGGVQGYCATFEEAMGLLDAAYNDFPEMKPNEDVTLTGV